MSPSPPAHSTDTSCTSQSLPTPHQTKSGNRACSPNLLEALFQMERFYPVCFARDLVECLSKCDEASQYAVEIEWLKNKCLAGPERMFRVKNIGAWMKCMRACLVPLLDKYLLQQSWILKPLTKYHRDIVQEIYAMAIIDEYNTDRPQTPAIIGPHLKKTETLGPATGDMFWEPADDTIDWQQRVEHFDFERMHYKSDHRHELLPDRQATWVSIGKRHQSAWYNWAIFILWKGADVERTYGMTFSNFNLLADYLKADVAKMLMLHEWVEKILEDKGELVSKD